MYGQACLSNLRDDGFFGFYWETVDAINTAFYFAYHHGLIGALGDFGHDVAITFNRGTARAINALHPFDGFFYANTDTFFHFYRRGTQIRHAYPNDGYFEHGELFLIGRDQAQPPADQKHNHEQVGGDRVVGEPADGGEHGALSPNSLGR